MAQLLLIDVLNVMAICDYTLDYNYVEIQGKNSLTACPNPKSEDERLSDRLCY